MVIAEFILFLSLAIILYVYALYPILIGLFGFFCKKQIVQDEEYRPMVTMIIAARNEEKIIEKKIINALDLEYPKDKFEILVVSDHSTDNTNNIVTSFQSKGVKLLALTARQGKTMAQNLAIQAAQGEIVVFSDANAFYDKQAIIKMVRHYKNPSIAFVSGQLNYYNEKMSDVGEKENFYWKYEQFIKRSENKIGCITGANGSIYSVRKNCYVPLKHDIISDFIEPMVVYANGGQVLYETTALSWEDVSTSFTDEFLRRRRIILRSIYSLFRYSYLLNPFKSGILAFELFSHKLLRWFCPFFMITLFFANLFLLHITGFVLFLGLQIIFYFFALCGKLNKKSRVPFFILIPYYFVLINYASFLAIIDFFRGKNKVFWEPLR